MKLNKHAGILFLSVFLFTIPFVVLASETNGTVVSGGNNGYAWSNDSGWVNFGATDGNIHITDNGITGYAWNSNYGWINMNPSNGGVHVATNGNLSGYAWGSNLGWINFTGVSITSLGKITGTASGDIIGTLTFDCTNCSIETDYLPKDFRTNNMLTNTSSSGSIALAPVLTTKTIATNLVSTQDIDNSIKTSVSSVSKNNYKLTQNTLPKITNIKKQPHEQVFNIRLLLDSSKVLNSEDVVSRVMFTNFGSTPTSVKMFFSVVNSVGKIIWSGEATTIVQSEKMYTKRLPQLNLPVGAYIFDLSTNYNKNVSGNFSMLFKIVPSDSASSRFPLIAATSIFLLLILMIIKIAKSRGRIYKR